ncbi:MAG: peptidoglycan editing factor PgeF [Bacillus sp. (in: Bacteria)]|nr:peptidoglycan editing factor PgeF [Bacillus sp. (in: firmicutes)]MCM1427067.1 peptidoglycan editing factor PgeF [Eubacterium sp.]
METLIRKKSEMQIRQNRSGDIEYLTFPLLEETGMVRHLFSTRLGGASKGEFSSMNLSYTRGDEKEDVDENYRRIAGALGCELSDIVCSDQTHTTNIRKVDKADGGKGILFPKDYTDIDGLITNEPGIVLATFYADCVPLFFIDTKNRAIGLSHSGWRGTAGRMGARTIEEMKREYGTRPEDVTAAIGPSICGDCYEVSEDVAAVFIQEFHEDKKYEEILTDKGNGKYLLDLWKANEIVLTQAGVLPVKIQVTDICTCCNPKYLFSHRASHGRRGNLGAFLGIL